jgi:GAF domain-containing protein
VDPEAAIALCRDVIGPAGAPETPLGRALSSGAVLESAVSEDWLGMGARSHMFVPLVARGRTLGALTLALVGGTRRYDEHDLNVARNLASRGALALDNARLFQELGDEMRLVETLNAFGNRVTAELNLEAMLALAAEEAAAQVGAEFGVFAYRPVDDQGEGLVRVATADTPPDVVELLTALPRAAGITRVADLNADPRGRVEGRVRSSLAVPVDLADGAFIGTLYFGHSRPGPGRFY